MSGGIAYVYDPRGRSISAISPWSARAVALPSLTPTKPSSRQPSIPPTTPAWATCCASTRALTDSIERHLLYTNSARARSLLEHWDEALKHFVKVMPVDYRRALIELQAERPVAAE
jgi:glutamate synthase (NADPH/NADH) large chain